MRAGRDAEDQKGSGSGSTVISWRWWSSTYMTPADVKRLKQLFPPGGCRGRRTTRLAPGWQWFIRWDYCTVRAGWSLSFHTCCAHWTGHREQKPLISLILFPRLIIIYWQHRIRLVFLYMEDTAIYLNNNHILLFMGFKYVTVETGLS